MTRLVATSLRTLCAAIAIGVLGTALPARADPALPDPGFYYHDEDPAPLPGAGAAKHLYIFGTPYTWPGALTWRYNDAGRPAGIARTEAISTINAAAAQWMAACNVRIAQGTDTNTPAQTINGTASSPNENVIGWGDLSAPPNGSANTAGVTYTSGRPGALVDADTTYSTRWVTSVPALQRVSVHELGHALGLSHSNVEGQLMSGPSGGYNPGVPPTQYAGVTTLQSDDIQGCLCLYGPGPNTAGRGYFCDLPAVRDFGSVAIGANSAQQTVALRNDATTGFVILSAITFSTPDFQYTGGCYPSTTLAPGAGCSFGVVFMPVGEAGPRQAYARIDVGELGPYKFPMTGIATGASLLNYEGLWGKAPAGSELGWGVTFTHQGDTVYATWFTYGFDGKALWLAAVLRRTASGAYSGEVVSVTGPPFYAEPFDPARTAGTTVGTMTVNFADGRTATFSYTVYGVTQTKAITRTEWASPPTCVWGAQPNLALATNFQDLWWAAPAGVESGWGITLTHQGDVIFGTWFTYGADGKPQWYTIEARQTMGNVFTGPVRSYTGPPFNAQPFDPAQVVETIVGTATFSFADGNHGTFAYTVGAVAQSKAITREVWAPPGTVCQ